MGLLDWQFGTVLARGLPGCYLAWAFNRLNWRSSPGPSWAATEAIQVGINEKGLRPKKSNVVFNLQTEEFDIFSPSYSTAMVEFFCRDSMGLKGICSGRGGLSPPPLHPPLVTRACRSCICIGLI